MEGMFLEDFGQKVDLTRRIREVLANYPEGTTVLKEIIQNADDAGATTVSFCLDKRTHPSETVLSPHMKEWQGASLLAYNDSQFTEEDFVSISRIGDSQKRGQDWKTGRFGVGFNSVYHLTDLPSFVSDKYVVFFDPQGKYLPNIATANPGKRIDFVNSSAISLYEDQFSPFCAFGCNMKNPFSGTLFRFPLRTVGQADVSKLSRQSYSVEDVDSLFSQLFSEASLTLLFLKSIARLEMYIWHANAENPELLYSCQVNSHDSETICNRRSLFRLPNVKSIMNPLEETMLLDFVTEVFNSAIKRETSVSTYLVVQRVSSLTGKIGKLVSHAVKEHDLHLLPWGSVAACISDNDVSGRQGNAFCSLPLPVRTGFTAHINGYFELSSNRRDIWYGVDMDRAGKLRSEWNICLLKEVVAPAFVELLAKGSEILGPVELYYSLWPCGSFEEPWKTLAKQIFKNLWKIPCLFSCIDGGRWVQPDEAYIFDQNFSKSEDLVNALTCLGMPIVSLNKPLVDTLFSYCDASQLNVVCPGTVRRMLQKLKTTLSLSREHHILLLEYCLDDVIDDEVGIIASGLALIPLANGEYGIFEECSKGATYFLCNDVESELLESVTDRVVDRHIPKNILSRLESIASTLKTNVVGFNSSYLLQLLPRILPANWRHKDIVQWNPTGDKDYPSEAFIAQLWSYLRDNCKDLSGFTDWPLLPLAGGFLSKASTNSKVLEGSLLPELFSEVLLKIGCKVLSPVFKLDHPQLELYISNATAPAILDAISGVAHQQHSELNRIFGNVTDNERRELRQYLLDQRWFGEKHNRKGQMTRLQINLCKKLPIFEVCSDAVDSVNSIFTDLVTSEKLLVPSHMNRHLLGPDFLCNLSESEEEVLLRYFGVERIRRPQFYRLRVFNRISEISSQMLEDIVISILQELPQLCMHDPSFKEFLKSLEFLPCGGRLRSPSSLYDPRYEELYNLLEGNDCFPSGKFRDPAILDVLQQLGLRTAVSPETILHSAKQIESMMHENPSKANLRGKVLLSYLDLNANKWSFQGSLEPNKSVNKILAKVTSAFQLPEENERLKSFWNDLRMISWCPVLVDPPYQLLPWPAFSTTVAPPKLVCLPTDVWLVSASMRILDGECRSDALLQHLGWSSLPGGSTIARQLLELGKNHEAVVDRVFRQELALSMPRIYSVLSSMLGTDEMDILSAILEGSRWIWVGDGFAKVDEVVLTGPLHLAPYVRVIPVDLEVFKELFLELGVRNSLSPRDFAFVLSKMAAHKSGSPLDTDELRAAILMVQSLADAHFHDSQLVSYIPDTKSVLMPAKDLTYNDAPWLANYGEIPMPEESTPLTLNKKVPRFVHGNISNEVAERLGVCSLRRLLLAESADSLKIGLHGAAEAFGQHEALTTRLKHIVEMYADGPGILFELVQNADDAGASEVCFLLDKTHYGTSSLLSPQMAEWQGPALYCYNNSVFSSQDLYAISRIGQDSKLEKPFTIGRFGLGFNCVYHFTDIPGFISGDNIVMFDPHASNLPGITPSHPGLRISFTGRGILEQFPDQFSPYLHFGCDLQKSYPGTLFRFPLRTANAANSSQIKKESYQPDSVMSLFSSFYRNAGEALLFLRNVSSISIFVKEDASHEMALVHRISRKFVNDSDCQSVAGRKMLKYVHGDPGAGINKEQFYQSLGKMADSELPWTTRKVVLSTMDLTERSELWIVSECLGGGRAKRESVAHENRGQGFVPWASVAAKLQSLLDQEACSRKETGNYVLQDFPSDSEPYSIFVGCAFCFLPLPIQTGLPVHVNAYFELSSNRRDIWFGDDMKGGGKLRSDWNKYLLEDAAASAYAHLLASIASEIGPSSAYYMLWPTMTLRRPWSALVQKLYVTITDLEVHVLFTKAKGGQWISAKRGVFPDHSFSEADVLGSALADEGLLLFDVPNSVVTRFQEFCPSLRYLTPQLLRDLLIRRKHGFKQRETMLVTLKYCLSDIDENTRIEKLDGLPLVPLATGLFTTFCRHGQGDIVYLVRQTEYDLLKDAVPYLLIDPNLDEQVLRKLETIASNKTTNIFSLTPTLLAGLMQKFYPVDMNCRKAVLWTPGHLGQPTLEWMALFWNYLNVSCSDLSLFSQWPVLPTTDGHLLQLVRNSNVISDDGWTENIFSLLKKSGCFILRRDIEISHPALGEYVQSGSANGMLNAFLVAAGDKTSLHMKFKEVSEGERRELRSYLCQSKWFSSGQMNTEHLEIMKSLPIYESYKNREFVTLMTSNKFLKPDGIPDEFINEDFIHTTSEREYCILRDYLGVIVPSKNQFYHENIVKIFTEVVSETDALIRVVHELKAMMVDDDLIRNSLMETPFILSGKGSIEKPSRLYDPRILELHQMLHGDAYFPSENFRDPEVLDFLVTLGLKNLVGPECLLDIARSVALLYDEGKEEDAFKQGKCLLDFINSFEYRGSAITESTASDRDTVNYYDGMSQAIAGQNDESNTDIATSSAETLSQLCSHLNEDFWVELANTRWCPVHPDRLVSGLPWPKSIEGSLVPAKAVRPKDQMWLVSSTLRILDGECFSTFIQSKLGWLERPNVGVLAAQLIELSKAYAWVKSEPGGVLKDLWAENLQREIPKIYSFMQDLVETKEIVIFQSLLEESKWIWIGDNFVSSKELAFDSPGNFQPYLYAVTSELSAFRSLLMALGVRLAFGITDFINVLQCLKVDMKESPLTAEQMSFVLRILEAIADSFAEQGNTDAIMRSVLLPDSLGFLKPARELVYNDVPWIDKNTIEIQHFVHSSISNELAEQLGAKSLRYMSFIDQEITKDLRCLDYPRIKAILKSYGNEDSFLFDLLELADRCQAKKLHILYDKREHPRQSLLQPNLGDFQGPSVVIALEGAVLSTEEICSLQLNPPWKIRGQIVSYGSGLLSCYQLGDLQFIVSDGFLYLFDPLGVVLATASKSRDNQSYQLASAKMYSLKGTDLTSRFHDQFLPLVVDKKITWASADSTIIRIPLKSTLSDNDIDHYDDKVQCAFNKLRAYGSAIMLFLSSVNQISLSVWESGESSPTNEYSVCVDPSATTVRSLFPEKKWRKFQISHLFSSSSVVTKLLPMDICIVEGGTTNVDRWLVSITLGSGQTRNMALDRKYMPYNLIPIAGVAANVSRNGKATEAHEASSLLSPLPLSYSVNLPVSVFGCFLLCHNNGRYLFDNMDKDASAQNKQNYNYQLVSAWNSELMSCVRDSYVEMILETQRLRKDPGTSRLDSSIAKITSGVFQASSDRMYSFWPRSKGIQLSSDGLNSAEDQEWQCLVDKVIKPVYSRLVELPVWQLYGGEVVKVEDGMFLATPGAETTGNSPPVTVCSFIKEHYPVFSVPTELVCEIQAIGIPVKEITPKMVRALLKASPTSIVVRSVETHVDILDYCCSDLKLQLMTLSDIEASVDTQNPNIANPRTAQGATNTVNSRPVYSSSVMGSVGQYHFQNSRGNSRRGQGNSADLVGDPLEIVTNFGKALFDFGRGVVEDISRVGGSSVDGENGLSNAYKVEDINPQIAFIAREMKGLPCPTATKHLLRIGSTDLWIGNKEQQIIMQPLAVKFIHLQCFDRPTLREIFENQTVQKLLKLQVFSAQLLSFHLKTVFSSQWVSFVNVNSNSPWVLWEQDSSTKGPSPDWIRMFWKNIGNSDDERRLFSDWPLIPAIVSSPVLCCVRQCDLVFIPPSTEKSSMDFPLNRNSGVSQIGTSPSDHSSSINKLYISAFEEIDLKHPWLIPLLKRCNVPIYNRDYLDSNALHCCLPKPRQTLAQVVISKLLIAKQSGYFSPEAVSFSAVDCDYLFQLFASDFSPSPSLVPTYTTEELEMLKSLPIYKTVIGTYTSLIGHDCCVICPGAFFQPEDERCLCHFSAANGGLLFHVLGVPELQNEELLVKFGLPGFEQKSEHDQDCILIYVYVNWEGLQFQNSVVNSLRGTRFVKCGGHEGTTDLLRPSELLDPDDSLLSCVFASDVQRFPGGRFATEGWLRIMRKVGLRTSSEPEMLIECARRVEILAKDSVSDTGNADIFSTESPYKDEISLDVWSLANSVTEAILKQFAVLYGGNFCNQLCQIAFVPAEKGMPNIAGRKGGKRAVTSYSEAILLKDWPLGWSCAPILSGQNVIPPEFSWGALHLRSPPPFTTVLKHLQIVGKANGEETLARWPTKIDIKPVEEAFADVLKYLNNIWGTLSSSDVLELQKVPFIPVANGTRLVTASSLFVRLGLKLAPFAFELPSLYLPYVKILKELGLQDSPTYDSARGLLVQIQQSSGYQHLNPNELRAVLSVLMFICEEGKKSKSLPLYDAIVPDEGCRLVYANTCVYVDAHGSGILKEIDTSRIRFVNNQLSKDLCDQLGVKKLSDVVFEELDSNHALETLEAVGSFQHKFVVSKFRNRSFQTAVWSVIQNFKEHTSAFKQFSESDVRDILRNAAENFQFVRSVFTRFVMLPSYADITLRRLENSNHLIGDKQKEVSDHQVLQFVDRYKKTILVSESPESIAVVDSLAVVVSRLFNSPLCLPLSSLLNAPSGFEENALGLLRLACHDRNATEKMRIPSSQEELLGQELMSSDSLRMQFHPLRPFYAGEIVAWKSDTKEGEKLKYGRVPEDVRPSAGQALYRLKVETAPGRTEVVLSSNILSFRSMMAGVSYDSFDSHNGSTISSGDLHMQGGENHKSSDMSSVASLNGEQSKEISTIKTVSASEVVHAVTDMLSTAGISVDLGQQSLLQQILVLKEQLTVSQAALVLEQDRADSASKDVETTKAAWSCRVCLNSEIDTIVIPCGHVLCQRCCAAVTRCPFCRRQVSRSQRMYRP